MGQLSTPTPQRNASAGTGRQVYDQVRAHIAEGTLPPGARLPSTRALAADLGVSRTTVTAAYEQLAAEGYLVTAAGRAARVAAPLAAAPAAPLPSASARPPRLSRYAQRVLDLPPTVAPDAQALAVDFRYGNLCAQDFPTQAWRKAYQAELLRRQALLAYAAPEGELRLREALQGYLCRARGIVCHAAQIVVVQGTQQAIDLCARVLLDAEDAFAFEDPGYLAARHSFEATGATRVPLPVDRYGVDTAALPEAAGVRLAYVTPPHQFPLGGVLPVGRRMELLQWARRHAAWVIEDDYDGEFRYGQRPIDAMHSMDGDDRVVYIGTVSKALSPQLRLGYLVLPTALVPAFRQAKRLADRHAPVLEQRVLAALIASGAYERHVRRMRRAHERRRAVLLDAVAAHLPEAQVGGTAAGLHVVLWLPAMAPHDEVAFAARARDAGVGIYPLSPLFAGPPQAYGRPAGWVLGYASLPEDAIRRGVEALADVLRAWRCT